MNIKGYILGELLFQANVRGNVHLNLEQVRQKVLDKYARLDGKSIKEGATENYCIELQRYAIGNRVFMRPTAILESHLARKRIEKDLYKSSIQDTKMVGERRRWSDLSMFILNVLFT